MVDKVLFSSRTVEWATPPELFAELDREFRFTLDPCATAENAKCKRFFTKEDDGLSQPWADEVVFMNPPYGRGVIEKWMQKACQERLEGATVVALVHARTDTRWFHDWVYGIAELRFIKGRVKFVGQQGIRGNSTFPSMLAIYRPERSVCNETPSDRT